MKVQEAGSHSEASGQEARIVSKLPRLPGKEQSCSQRQYTECGHVEQQASRAQALVSRTLLDHHKVQRGQEVVHHHRKVAVQIE